MTFQAIQAGTTFSTSEPPAPQPYISMLDEAEAERFDELLGDGEDYSGDQIERDALREFGF